MNDIQSVYDALHVAGVRLALNPDGLRIDIRTEPERPIADDEMAVIRHNKRALMALLRDIEAGLFFESHGIAPRGTGTS